MKSSTRWPRFFPCQTPLIPASILFLGAGLLGCSETSTHQEGFSTVRLEASQGQVYGATDGPGALRAVWDVAISPRGRVLASQPTLAEIAVFEPGGAFHSTIGRRGEGPGEFQNPGAIRFKGDTLTVLDFMSGINLFSSDGAFIDRVSFTLPTPPEFGFPTRPALLLADGSVACNAPLRSILIVNGQVTHASWVKAAWDGELLDTLVKYPVDGRYSMVSLPAGGPFIGAPPKPWDDILAVPPGGSHLVVVNRTAAFLGTEPLIRLHRIDLSGDTVRSRIFRYEARPLTQEWRDSVSFRWAESQAERRNMTVDRLAGIYRDQIEWPAHHPAVSEVIAGSDGTTWMKREVPFGDSIRWDLVDSTFEPLGFTILPNSLAVKRVSRSAVWGVVLDEWDIPWIVRYDVRDPG